MDPRYVYVPPYYMPPYVQYHPNGQFVPASSADATSDQPPPASASTVSASTSTTTPPVPSASAPAASATSASSSNSAAQTSTEPVPGKEAAAVEEAKEGEKAVSQSSTTNEVQQQQEPQQHQGYTLREQWLQQVYQQRLAHYQSQLYMYNQYHPYVLHGDQIVYQKATPSESVSYEPKRRGPPEIIEIEDPSFYEADPWPVKEGCPFIII